MAYKPGVALAASVTLIICSVILLGLYVACGSMNCSGIPASYAAPLWTGGLTLLTGIIGVFMSTTKSEKGCGPLFLAVSIICIFLSLACMCLSTYASIYGFLYGAIAPIPVVNFGLWMAMMCTAFVLSIVTCVTSCQNCCCCQETRPAETVIVYQGGSQVPQNIILTNPNIIQQPQQQGQPQVVFLNPYGASPGGQVIQQGYSVPQVLNQPIGGAPAGLHWHPPPNAARGVYPNQYMVAPGQTQPSAPPPYQERAPVANQIRPVTAGQDQSQAVQPSTTPCPQPPSIYQALITQNNQTSAPQIQQRYVIPEQAQQGVRDPPQHLPDPPTSNPTYAYAQTTEQSSAEVTDDGFYLDPNTESSSPLETPASGIGSGAYEYIEEPSYDYADPGLAREIVSSAEHSQYINDRVAKRPKAKRPK